MKIGWTYGFKLFHVHVGEVCLQGGEVCVGAAAASKASWLENLEAAVAGVADLHRWIIGHLLHHHNISALSSSIDAPILQEIANLTLVILVHIHLLHSLLLNCHLLIDIHLHHLLFCLHLGHVYLWRLEERGSELL